MRSFDIPIYYRSPIISRIKEARKLSDPRRRDFSPAVLDLGPLRLKIARHFGFCFGVENAIEIAYRTLSMNSQKRVFLLSEMIHNPHVNEDLRQRGVRFIMNPDGEQLVPWNDLTPDDVVIVPAFGTTLETAERLSERGIDPYQWDTTCPFVEKVWNRSRELGEREYTVVIHGKPTHEETQATFSHSRSGTPTVVVRNMEEAERLATIIEGTESPDRFTEWFSAQASRSFDPGADLMRLGVVNQTTMLASETQAIADRIRQALVNRYGIDAIDSHFADTRDTLCYATNENQTATQALLSAQADCAIVVGGYNSSNTSHLVELLAAGMPTWFICDADEIISRSEIAHFDINQQTRVVSEGWLPVRAGSPVEIALTSGASCPDALVDQVIERLVSFFPDARPLDDAVKEALHALPSP